MIIGEARYMHEESRQAREAARAIAIVGAFTREDRDLVAAILEDAALTVRGSMQDGLRLLASMVRPSVGRVAGWADDDVD